LSISGTAHRFDGKPAPRIRSRLGGKEFLGADTACGYELAEGIGLKQGAPAQTPCDLTYIVVNKVKLCNGWLTSLMQENIRQTVKQLRSTPTVNLRVRSAEVAQRLHQPMWHGFEDVPSVTTMTAAGPFHCQT